MKAGNLARAYFKNIAQAALGSKHTLDTMVATYYVTSMCNFRCSYCEHFSADLNHLVKDKQASTDQAERIMEVIRKDCDVLYLTGGEPLLRNDIEELCLHARSLDFAYLSLNTNGLLLPRRERVLDAVDNVVISLDSLDTAKLDRLYGVGQGTAQKVLDIIAHYARHRAGRKYLLTVNCVVTPETVDEAEAVMEFCFAHGAEFSVSPQNQGVRPHPGLVGNPRYRRFMERLIAAKRAGKPVSGARIYYEHMREFTPFQCFPTLTARVDPEGNVSFPCRPLDEAGQIGGKAGNLLEVGSLRAVQALGKARFGERIPCHDQCYMRCHAELSLLVRNPSKLFYETTSYLARTIGRGGRAPDDGTAPRAPSTTAAKV
ncbi:MAG: radical SAM protein [Deltaproteobacteria bacterium]|nr:radical SAM protein [Deltaproteobacteria bacterium]